MKIGHLILTAPLIIVLWFLILITFVFKSTEGCFAIISGIPRIRQSLFCLKFKEKKNFDGFLVKITYFESGYIVH